MAPRRYLLLFLFGVPSYQRECTNAPPVTIPITDVALSSGHAIRGALMTVGNPPQNLSWIPQMYLNNTWTYNTTSPYCPKDKTNRWCNTYRGGLYDPGQSSNAKPVADVHAAGGSPSDTDRTIGLHVWDSSWVLDGLGVDNITLDDFPIGLPGFDYGEQYHPQGSIGLGGNSTLLTALKDAGHISSRSYGYWWGEDGATPNAQMDGSLVLGGYDAAKTQGSNITSALRTPSPSCMSGMYMTITDIVMRFPNSTRSSIVAPRAPLSACLQIDFPAMLAFARQPYYDQFEGNSQSFTQTFSVGIDWWNPIYDPSTVYQGSLVVVFDDGLELAIPNELLVVPERLIDDSGEVQLNSTYAEVLIQPTDGDNAGDTPRIGKQFFSSTYLFVDHDAGTFTVWQANSTSDTRLVSVGGDCDTIKTQEAPVSSSSAAALPKATDTRQTNSPQADSPQTTAPQTASDQDEDSGSLSTGVIVGVAVGAGGSLAVIAIILVACFMRKKKRNQRAEKSLLSNDSAPVDYKSSPYSFVDTRHELHNAATSELAAAQDARELDSVESKRGYSGYKPRNSPHQVYELATRSP